jgi:hypothetical protein
MWDFAQGYAALRRGDLAAAGKFAEPLRRAAASSRTTFRVHPASSLLGVVSGILDGELARAAGDSAAGIAALTRAVTLQDGLLIDDPAPFPFAARHWLGAALIDVKRFAEAERVYREDLVRHPHNGWALVGLQQALRAQAKPTREVDDELRASWTRADVKIAASRF